VVEELTGAAVAAIDEIEQPRRSNPLVLLGRVLVLPRSTFIRLADEDVSVWPFALGVIAFVAFAKAALGIMLAWRGGTIAARLLPAALVRYGGQLIGPIAFAFAVAGIIQLAQRFWEGDAPFRRTLSAVSLALMPLVLRDLLQIVYMAVRHRVLLHPGLSALLAPPGRSVLSRIAYGVLGQIDVFTLWVFVLLTLAVLVTHGRGWLAKLVTVLVAGLLTVLVAAVPGFLIAPLFR
jgi:hypothetical protein